MFTGTECLDRIPSSLGADEPSLLAFAPRDDGIHTDAETNLRLIAATSRCPFYATDGVLLNVECFGPRYTGTVAEEDANNKPADQYRRSFHNSDQWPLLLYVHGVCGKLSSLFVF